MILHLKGRPCRLPERAHVYESITDQWNRVTCSDCRATKKWERLYRAARE
jgi:hypothetical protein